ncbi:YchJ family protein [Yinghuangia seranimata]|uniref:YchJ family protein n=1 Tax=Yinghuangia seranimata TaxID=408067 RepID=UPI003CCF93D3
MRARYSAYAVGDREYLVRSWHRDSRPDELDLDPKTRWLGLEITSTTDGGPFHDRGVVAFRARYRERGQEGVLEETSRFVRDEAGEWVYVDGLVR